ncbi:CPBP family intramembrane glutamic endopeptidase [Actinoplanes sp. NPDC024001]|uniref:CPBP family intramembrane glutamic endopeptidase n=1 Tax=Actinoplanes sp. NPDC024001 TaxID=3154598 RepID=UPI0034027DE7
MTTTRINFLLFTIAAVGAGWAGVALDRAGGEAAANEVAFSTSDGTLGQLLFILGPAVAGLLLYFLSRDGAGPLGLTLRFAHRTRWFGFAALFYPLAAAVLLGLGLVAGAATLSGDAAAFLTAFLTVFAVQLIKNPIEEFTFRGYGTRTAMALGLRGAATPHLLVGAVWAAWHLPLYLVWTSEADMRLVTSLSMPLFLVLLFAGLMAAALLYGEMRVRTGSIWPGVLMHSMSNAIVTPLLVEGYVSFPGHGDVLFSPVASSVLMTVLTAATGLFLISRRPRRAAVPPTLAATAT